MLKYIFIIVIFLITGCLNNNLIDDIKADFAQEKKAIIYNKSINKQLLNIPLNGMILVKENETIYSISNKYMVIPNDIIKDINLIEPFNLKINQILFLRNKNTHIIKKNDTLVKISIQYAVDQLDIINLNKLKKPFNLLVGRKILIPIKKNYSVIDQILEQKIFKKDKNYTKNVNLNLKSIINAPKFLWPIKGIVVKDFGNFGRGQHYDGIDISSKKNIPILSSLNGKVAFVGSQIKKFGNLILIKHKNGWLTAYSNIGNFNVKEGDIVVKGQTIAYSSINNKKFHFQIRYNRNPVDPLKYLN